MSNYTKEGNHNLVGCVFAVHQFVESMVEMVVDVVGLLI